MEPVLSVIICVMTLFIVARIKIKITNNQKNAVRFLRSRFFRFVSIIVNSISVLFIAYFPLLPGTANRLEIITALFIFFSFTIQLFLKMESNIFDSIKR